MIIIGNIQREFVHFDGISHYVGINQIIISLSGW